MAHEDDSKAGRFKKKAQTTGSDTEQETAALRILAYTATCAPFITTPPQYFNSMHRGLLQVNRQS